MKLILNTKEEFLIHLEKNEKANVINALELCKQLNGDDDISNRIGVSTLQYDETCMKFYLNGDENILLTDKDLLTIFSVFNDLINGYGVNVDKIMSDCWNKLFIQIEILLP